MVRSAELYPYQNAEDADPQREHPALLEHEISSLFSFFYNFCLPGSVSPDPMNPVQKQLEQRARAPLHCTCSFLCIEIMEADSDVQIWRRGMGG